MKQLLFFAQLSPVLFVVLSMRSERARANSIQTQHVHVHSKCFTIPESYEKVNSYKDRKNNNYNTEKLLKAIAK